jgi:hypothetical protein
MRPTDKTRNQDLPRGQGGDHSTLYVSLELSRSTWLVTSLSPNSDKMSKHTIAAGDASKLLALLTRLRGRAEQLVGGSLSIAVIETPHWGLPANVAARPIIGNLQNVFSAFLSDIRHAKSK